MIKFLPLGGADDIGASCFYLNISGTGILLDCGTHPRKKGIDSLPKFELLKDLPVDFVIVSHSHQDHIGSLPFLVQNIPHVIVYSTIQTKEIADITLHNAANILAHNQDGENQLRNYTHEEIDLLVRSMRTADYNKEFVLEGMRHNSGLPVRIMFTDAGHILGAAGIIIEHNGEKIFYTGDINLSSQTIMTGADLSRIKKIDTLIMESTYAATESSKLGSWQSELERFTKQANLILHKGGSILIPVFALGKTQEMLASIYALMKKGSLTETNIYTGGIGKDISALYDRNRYLVRRKSINLELKEIPQINLFDVDDYNFFKKNPGIILASSGMMLEGTTSFRLLEYWIKQESFAVFGVGYMDYETPGYRIMNSKRGDEIRLTEFRAPQKINCGVERFFFPSHSKREELLELVDYTSTKRVIMVHGEQSSKDWLGFNILSRFKDVKLHSAENGTEIRWGNN
ncbi:MAG: MBL fold metallo-hydrolase [Ignavibacteriae bacterium HGW-Ignavibacteriae-3]|nr:MAG: MBL fold metallo-hydrolase [Ignavibacteriae bacterium HGW-Ignavibacteriae-3]